VGKGGKGSRLRKNGGREAVLSRSVYGNPEGRGGGVGSEVEV